MGYLTTGFHLLLHEHKAAPPSLTVYHQTHQIQRTGTHKVAVAVFSGLDITAVIASKMFLDAMADLLGNRWALCNTALDEIHIPWVKYHLLVDLKALARTWACEAHFGPLSQVIFQMSLEGAFIATYSYNYRRKFKTIFLRNTESIVLIWWKLKRTGNIEWVPGPLRPPLAVWGLISLPKELPHLQDRCRFRFTSFI